MVDQKKSPPPPRKSYLSRLVLQFLGLGVGVGLSYLLTSVYPPILERMRLESLLTWGAVLGVAIFSAGQFEQAGAALTRRDDRRLNLLVGWGALAVILILVALVLP